MVFALSADARNDVGGVKAPPGRAGQGVMAGLGSRTRAAGCGRPFPARAGQASTAEAK